MEDISIERLFLEWKDEEMLLWDEFIYNMKLFRREVLFMESTTPESVIDNFRFNFDITVTTEDLHEREYLVYFTRVKYDFYPSNEDLKKLLFYDIKFIDRLTISTNLSYGSILDRIFYQYIPDTNLASISYQRNRYDLYYRFNDYYDSSNMEEINKAIENGVDTVYVNEYDKSLNDERIKKLFITEITDNTSKLFTFPETLTYLNVGNSLINCILPNSLLHLDCEIIKGIKLPPNLISLRCNVRHPDKLDLPDSLVSLDIDSFSMRDLPNLQYLKIQVASGNFPELKFLITDKVYKLIAPKLECLLIDEDLSGAYNRDFKQYPKLKILRIPYNLDIKMIPKSLELLWITSRQSYDMFNPDDIPKHIKYFICSYLPMKITSGDYVYLEAESIDAKELKNLKICLSNEIVDGDNLIHYYKKVGSKSMLRS